MTADQLVEKALAKAQGAQAWIVQSDATNVSYENDRLKSATSAQTTHISARVILNGKLGSSNTTDMDDADGVVERALEAAQFGSTAHFEFPAPAEPAAVKLYDAAVPVVSKETLVDIAGEMLAVVRESNPDILVDARAGKNVTKGEFANAAGVEFTTESSAFSVGVSGQWIRGTDILMAGEHFGWKKREIDHVKVAGKAVRWFELAEKGASVRSGDMPVVLTPEGVCIILLSLRMALNGKNVVLGSSPLKGKLGETIADERFCLSDDPLVDYGPASAQYDGEGVCHRRTPLVADGVLANFLYDLDSAGRAGTKTTGNGPGCGPTNLVVSPGETPYDQMIGSVNEGLLVHSVLGLGQGNPMNGDFSVNVQLGYKIESGKIAGRVKNVMLAGNVYDAIKNIDSIGDKSEWVWGSTLAPPVKIGKLSVVAK